ncbi:MAG TPA: hypothetical protein VGI16_10305 [Candidatus Acidoferrum sp.]|jgi:hypothetical protein
MIVTTRDELAGINARIAVLLSEAQCALRGEQEFGVLQVRALSEPIGKMASVMQRASELRTERPELAPEIDFYRAQLVALETVLEQVRVMLLTTRENMQKGRAQVAAMTRWAAVLRQTQ